MVALTGAVREPLLAELSPSPNVSVIRPAGGSGHDDGGLAAAAGALREAASRMSPYVLVPADPLAALAAAWQAMWEPARPAAGSAGFEQRAGEAVAAWRAGTFDLPDYYLVVTPCGQEASPGPAGGLHLGPLRAVRPRRVTVVAAAEGTAQAAGVLQALAALPHGPWWPPLDELVDAARRFFAGGLSEGASALAAATG